MIFDGTLMQGGAERVISILSHHMIERGFKVEILLYYDREIFYEIDKRIKITIVEKESKTNNVLRNLVWMRRYFKEYADVILSFLAPFNILALVSHFGLKSKIIVADRNDPRYIPENKIIRSIRDLLYLKADGIVLQTTHNKNYFNRKIQRKSTVIPNPIDLGNKAGSALTTTKVKEIVSVGRLMPQKNQKMLLEAFREITEEFPEYQLIIYGEGPERENLEKEAIQLEVEEKVHLPGSVKDVYDRICSSELFVLTSFYEGMPNALIEAMCLGLPCITTRVSGAEDLIKSGMNGEIIDIGDRKALVQSIRLLLSNDDLRIRYGNAALVLNTELSVDKIMDKWISFLSTL